MISFLGVCVCGAVLVVGVCVFVPPLRGLLSVTRIMVGSFVIGRGVFFCAR